MPKVSVIIPVYNSVKYLDISLPTVLNQSLQDIEIICIDDGSTDNSLVLLRNYAEKDNRIKIITQKNMTQGVARNNGLKHATGEYVLFFDSDDEMYFQMLEVMYYKAKEVDADLVVSNYAKFCPEKNRINYINLRKDITVPENEVFDWKLYKNWVFHSPTFAPWNKMVKRSLMLENRVKFLEKTPCEDVLFSLQSLIYAGRTVFINQPLLKYNCWTDSSCRAISNHNLNLFENMEIIRNFIKESGFESLLKDDFSEFLVNTFSNHYYIIPDNFKKVFDKKAKKYLTDGEYKQYKTKLYGHLSFIQNIFSIVNYHTLHNKYKYLNILGAHFCVGKK